MIPRQPGAALFITLAAMNALVGTAHFYSSYFPSLPYLYLTFYYTTLYTWRDILALEQNTLGWMKKGTYLLCLDLAWHDSMDCMKQLYYLIPSFP